MIGSRSEDYEHTGTHSLSVIVLPLSIGDELRMEHDERRSSSSARCCTTSKMSTPKEILNQPGPLDDDEWETMRGTRSTDSDARPGRWDAAQVGTIVRGSHERYDGTGYPERLRAEEIPLPARGVAVADADAYSAMTTRRSYREAMVTSKAEQELRGERRQPNSIPPSSTQRSSCSSATWAAPPR